MKTHDSFSLDQHAYICEGNPENVIADIETFCVDGLCINLDQNKADFHRHTFDRFTIGDARHISDIHQTRPQKGNKKIFILQFNFITPEAQNALLKLLEEPHDDTLIFIIVSRAHMFLDTIMSRVRLVRYSDESLGEKTAPDFLKMNPKDRLAYVGKIAEEIKKHDTSKAEAIAFVEMLEDEISKQSAASNKKTCMRLETVRDYLHDSGSSAKILLEYVALLV